MDIKDVLKNCINNNLGSKASDIFINRAMEVIDTSAKDRDGYLSSANKIKRMVMLFIEKELALEIYDKLKLEIDSYSWS